MVCGGGVVACLHNGTSILLQHLHSEWSKLLSYEATRGKVQPGSHSFTGCGEAQCGERDELHRTAVGVDISALWICPVYGNGTTPTMLPFPLLFLQLGHLSWGLTAELWCSFPGKDASCLLLICCSSCQTFSSELQHTAGECVGHMHGLIRWLPEYLISFEH